MWRGFSKVAAPYQNVRRKWLFRKPRVSGAGARRRSAGAEAEVSRVDAADVLPARGADREADPDLAEPGVQDVRPVAGAVHPGGDDRPRRTPLARAPGDVLAEDPAGEPAGQVADEVEAPVESRLAGAVVAEAAGTDHAVVVALGGLLKLLVGPERPDARHAAFGIDQALNRLAALLKGELGRARVPVGAAGVHARARGCGQEPHDDHGRRGGQREQGGVPPNPSHAPALGRGYGRRLAERLCLDGCWGGAGLSPCASRK